MHLTLSVSVGTETWCGDPHLSDAFRSLVWSVILVLLPLLVVMVHWVASLWLSEFNLVTQFHCMQGNIQHSTPKRSQPTSAEQGPADMGTGVGLYVRLNLIKFWMLFQECAADLAAAKPIVDAALAALDALDKSSLTELKSMGKPPDGVDNVTAAVMVLMADPKKIPKDRSWASAKKMMANVTGWLKDLLSFDANNIPQALVDVAEPISQTVCCHDGVGCLVDFSHPSPRLLLHSHWPQTDVKFLGQATSGHTHQRFLLILFACFYTPAPSVHQSLPLTCPHSVGHHFIGPIAGPFAHSTVGPPCGWAGVD